jgi:hypothetical protein
MWIRLGGQAHAQGPAHGQGLGQVAIVGAGGVVGGAADAAHEHLPGAAPGIQHRVHHDRAVLALQFLQQQATGVGFGQPGREAALAGQFVDDPGPHGVIREERGTQTDDDHH